MTDKDAAKKAWDLKCAKDFEAKKAWVKLKTPEEQKEIFKKNPELEKACKADLEKEAKANKLKAKLEKNIAVHVDEGEVLHVQMGTDERFIIDACFTDEFGNEAEIKGYPYWEVSDDTVVTIFPSPCGRHVDVRPAGNFGDAYVSVYAEGADGEIYREVHVSVVAGFATDVQLTVSEPEVL